MLSSWSRRISRFDITGRSSLSLELRIWQALFLPALDFVFFCENGESTIPGKFFRSDLNLYSESVIHGGIKYLLLSVEESLLHE